LWTWDGEQMHRQAFRGVPDELLEEFREPLKPPPGSIPERIISGERVVSDLDVLEGPRRSAILARLGARSCVGVALRKDNKLLGGITIYRGDVRPFAEKQLALLQNFAVQAVIAMENARLITETREALEQQTATAEVLGVINSSPGDLAPVFDAVLEKALRICDAAFGTLASFDGEGFPLLAAHGVSEAYLPLARYRRPNPGMALHRLALGETLVHVADVSGDDMYRSGEPGRVSFVEQAGARTTIWVALRKDDALLGALTIYRTEVRTFTEKQIALLQSFAAQAVIAMENARLITETREALDQQTATAEVLGVINSSPGDLTPLFDAMLERAVRLCEADSGHLALPDGDDYRTAAAFAMSPEMESLVRAQSYAPGRGTAVGRALLERCVVQIEDVGADNEHAARQVASKGLSRTVV